MSLDYNPFQRYLPRLYRPSIDDYVSLESKEPKDVWVMPELYQTTLQVEKQLHKKRVMAIAGPEDREQKIILYDKDDLASWRGHTLKPEVVSNLQGRIGDRGLSLILYSLTEDLRSQAVGEGYDQSRGEVLEEQRRGGRPFKRHVVQWKGRYLLRFDRRTTFHLFVEAEEGEPFLYVKERRSYYKCEIDGLAPFYVQKSGEETIGKYLIIGEMKTAKRRINSGFWRPSDDSLKGKSRESLEERVFQPFKSLYPEYHLVYLLAGTPKALFQHRRSNGHTLLRPRIAEFVEMVYKSGIMPVITAIPSSLNCRQLAEEFYDHLMQYQAEQVFMGRIMNRVRGIDDFSSPRRTEQILRKILRPLPKPKS